MRLLNTKTLRLEDFRFNVKKPDYVILSHTWEADEILFGDVEHGTSASWRHKAGCAKVFGAASLARTMRYDYLWMDSCCIDKASSAELSETLNSMYQWYQQSAICFAFLADVRIESFKRDFSRCRWFTRVQELIAPRNLQFYDLNWSYLGSRRDLAREIEEITQIDRPVLLKEMPLSEVSVSRKMAWAAERVTTKKEDQAYSLMGIFDVNMPLLYGEGDKAFHRLQEEIIRRTDDHSVLLCGVFSNMPARHTVLAPRVDCFRQGRQFRKPIGSVPSYIQLQGNTLQVNLLTAPVNDNYILGILDSCHVDDPTNLSRPALLLEERHGLCTRGKMEIFRVTPIDDYTANVKSESYEYSS
ncbi:HET-domain-containing protein [Xylaria nigripes]|nr:HET-domain-containing protein [Xylaria nigripes]